MHRSSKQLSTTGGVLDPLSGIQGRASGGGERKEYVGQTDNTFKMRYRGHVSDSNNQRKSTTLTTYILRRRREGLDRETMIWSKVSLTEPRARGDKDCSLCTT